MSSQTAGQHRRASKRRPMRLLLSVALVLLSGVTVTAAGTVLKGSEAAATTPGTPGTPQPGTAVYTEDFSNQSAAATAIDLRTYTGGAAADGETYTADPQWTATGGQCDGWVLSPTSALPTTDAGCQNNQPTGWTQLQAMAVQLGLAQGQTATQAAQNQALTEYTNASSGTIAGGIEFKTQTNTIPAILGHYYAVSAYFAETNCFAAQAQERFSLIIDGTPTVLSSGLDPCTSTATGTQVTKLQSAAIQIPFGTAASLGLQLESLQTSGAGNDVAFDLPQIVDVTPQLDKSFSPPSIPQGGTSTLTFTVTNTSELDAKTGWSFTDNLPSGLTVASPSGATSTCPNGQITVFGGNVLNFSGDLAKGMRSCTLSIKVTATGVGTYTNTGCTDSTGATIPGCTPNVTTPNGVNPPGPATLTVTPVVDMTITKTASVPDYVAGGPLSYTVKVTNSGPSDAVGATVSDPLPSSITGATWTCVASAGASCTASGSGNITDTVTIPVGGSVTYTVIGTVAAGTTGSLTNTATVVPPGGTTDPNCPSSPGAGCSSTVTLPTDALKIAKSASPTVVSAVGQTVTYSFLVTNTGQTTLTNVTRERHSDRTRHTGEPVPDHLPVEHARSRRFGDLHGDVHRDRG